jgi:hypothetical protein
MSMLHNSWPTRPLKKKCGKGSVEELHQYNAPPIEMVLSLMLAKVLSGELA